MRVIFLQDVLNVAKAGEVKEVADGYGRNYLIPRNLALLARPGATKQAELELKIKGRLQAEDEAKLAEVAQQLQGVEVTLKARAGAKERIYGSITAADIADALQNNTGLTVDKRKIELDGPIRQLGSCDVDIRLSKDIIAKIKVTVTEEETG